MEPRVSVRSASGPFRNKQWRLKSWLPLCCGFVLVHVAHREHLLTWVPRLMAPRANSIAWDVAAQHGYTAHAKSQSVVLLGAAKEEIDQQSNAETSLEESDPALAGLIQTEEEDEKAAQFLAQTEEVASKIVDQAIADTQDDPEMDVERTPAEVTAQEVDRLPSSPVYDLESLCTKWGGCKKVYKDHVLASEEGYFKPESLPEVKNWLFDYIGTHMATVRDSYVEFEYEGGAFLMLVGTNHLSRGSADFARDMVKLVKPECLVLERRLGDDSLQRLTVPEAEFMQQTMSTPPAAQLANDDPLGRISKFHQDRVWLESTLGWAEIGGEASLCHEFGAAFHEFVRQRLSSDYEEGEGGPRGGTVCFGDSDLRPVEADLFFGPMLPSTTQMGFGANEPLRDLQMAGALRLALRTHRRVVGVVGKDHLPGITKLLKQDARVKVLKEGIPIKEPKWVKDLEDGGQQWERAALATASIFSRLAAKQEETPYGTFFDFDAAKRLHDLRQENEVRLKNEGPGSKPPASSVSSFLATDMFSKGQAVTPRDEGELKRWLRGERVYQEAREFPYESRKALKRARAEAQQKS